jgi:putative DNA methylase
LKKKANALASSIVLVCRPRPDDALMASRRDFTMALRRELPDALREMQSGNIAPVDLAQASIGPGMAVYSRYAQVLEPDGSRMSVRTALQLINAELDAYLAQQEGDLDGDSRFAVTWFQQHGFKEGEFGQADVLARAKNTSVSGMVSAGILISGQGKVRLRKPEEYDAGWNPAEDDRVPVWEVTHHLIERYTNHGDDGAAGLLLNLSAEAAADAKDLAYRLYNICERKGWSDYARDYNALVIAWPGIQTRKEELRTEPQQRDMFE